jgi:hypothetical protein
MLQAPFEKCCQMLVLICTRGAGKSECDTWLSSAGAHQSDGDGEHVLQRFDELLRDRAFVCRQSQSIEVDTQKIKKKHAKDQRERENMVVAQIECNYVED